MGKKPFGQEARTSKRKLRKIAKEHEAVNLRLSGMTFEQIGAEIDVSPMTAHNYVDGVMKQYSREIEGLIPELIAFETARIERLISSLWSIAIGEEKRQGVGMLGAHDRVIALMKRKAKLLGLDRPYRMEVMHGLTPEALKEMQDRRWAQIEPRLIEVVATKIAEESNVVEGEFVESPEELSAEEEEKIRVEFLREEQTYPTKEPPVVSGGVRNFFDRFDESPFS